jgi:tetratricopeptide (TPR) repeat protein
MNRPAQPRPPGALPAPAPAEADSFALASARLDAQRPGRKPRFRHIAAHLQNNRLTLAEQDLSEHLARHPDDTDAIMLKAQAAARRGDRSAAAALLARCLELAPDFVAARFDYARLLVRLSRWSAALDEVDRLLSEDSSNPLFRRLKAGILGSLGEDGQSLAIWEQLAAENPHRAESWLMLGHALRAMGFQEKSVAAYRKAIELRPSFGAAYWSLANMKTVRFSDGDIAAMQAQLKRGDLAAEDRVNLLSSLGKAYEDIGAYDRSFENYAKANATMRLRIDYDWDDIASRVESNAALFTPAFLRSRSDAGCKAADPIFVLGRPRSGSTLIEQILASHSAVEGTAELPYIAALVRRLEEGECRSTKTDYPTVLGKLPPSVLTAFGEAYLADTRAHRKLGRPFFIDKSPNNYFHVGMIHLILPNAKIIDARRHPVACCLSMFKQNFSNTNLRLNELGRVYRDYVQLMAHFDSVLPGKIHRVIYEDMVGDPETEVRKLLDYLGLPFEERCLRFYETERTVRTPSSEQVRRPMSREAVDHWRHYEPWLGSLIRSLGSVLTAYPGVPEELR